MTLLLIQGLKLQEQSLCEIWYSCSLKKGQEHWWKCAMTLRAFVGRGLVLFTFLWPKPEVNGTRIYGPQHWGHSKVQGS